MYFQTIWIVERSVPSWNLEILETEWVFKSEIPVRDGAPPDISWFVNYYNPH